MPKFFVTFGQKYFHDPHPLGDVANPNGWVEVEAQNELDARKQVIGLIEDKWSMLYTEEEFTSEKYAFEEMRTMDYFPRGCTGTIRDGQLTSTNEQGES